jgi:hypothetical protein
MNLRKLGSRERPCVPTHVAALVPPLAKDEVRTFGYVLTRGRNGVRPWPCPDQFITELEDDAAKAMAERATIDRDSWSMIYRTLGLEKEFARMPRTTDPYLELRRLVVEKKIPGVIFAEDLLNPPPPAPAEV